MANNIFNATALANGTSTLTQRTSALNLSTDLVQAGVVFNDATRLLDGGAFAQPSDSFNQQNYLGMYTTDIHAVQSDIAAILATPANATLGGQAFTLNATDTAVLTEVNNQLSTLLTAAPQTTNAATATSAEQTLHSVQLQILGEINNDPHLAAALNNVQYASGTGALNHGFQQLPAGADDAASLAAATAGNSLAAVGTVFNAAADLADGGLNANNLTEFNTDMQAVASGVNNILNNKTMLAQIESGETANAAALTTIHLQTVLNQVDLQLNKFDGLVATDPNTADRSTNDNLLDIIDIVQNDANLNKAAGGPGTPTSTGGFAEFPAFLNGAGGVNAHGGTILQYQDNQAQTNFWSAFLAEANTINAQLQKVASGGEQASQALITQIENYQAFGAKFDAAQGGVFGDRFDNELLSGTLLADTNNAVAGLTGILNGATGATLAADKAQIIAAGMGFTADANDVSGNNIPIGGGSYVGTAVTVSTATSVHGVAMGTIPVTANPNIAHGTGGAATAATTTTGGGTSTGAGGTTTTSGTPAGSGGHTGTTTTTGTSTSAGGTAGASGSHTGTATTIGTSTSAGGTAGAVGSHTGTATTTGPSTGAVGTGGNGGQQNALLADIVALLQQEGVGNGNGHGGGGGGGTGHSAPSVTAVATVIEQTLHHLWH